MQKFKLNDGDHVVTAYAQPASGPGWANSPIYVVVRGRDGNLREECIQPEDQTREMHILYPYSARAQSDMVDAVKNNTVIQKVREKRTRR